MKGESRQATLSQPTSAQAGFGLLDFLFVASFIGAIFYFSMSFMAERVRQQNEKVRDTPIHVQSPRFTSEH